MGGRRRAVRKSNPVAMTSLAKRQVQAEEHRLHRQNSIRRKNATGADPMVGCAGITEETRTGRVNNPLPSDSPRSSDLDDRLRAARQRVADLKTLDKSKRPNQKTTNTSSDTSSRASLPASSDKNSKLSSSKKATVKTPTQSSTDTSVSPSANASTRNTTQSSTRALRTSISASTGNIKSSTRTSALSQHPSQSSNVSPKSTSTRSYTKSSNNLVTRTSSSQAVPPTQSSGNSRKNSVKFVRKDVSSGVGSGVSGKTNQRMVAGEVSDGRVTVRGNGRSQAAVSQVSSRSRLTHTPKLSAVKHAPTKAGEEQGSNNSAAQTPAISTTTREDDGTRTAESSVTASSSNSRQAAALDTNTSSNPGGTRTSPSAVSNQLLGGSANGGDVEVMAGDRRSGEMECVGTVSAPRAVSPQMDSLTERALSAVSRLQQLKTDFSPESRNSAGSPKKSPPHSIQRCESPAEAVNADVLADHDSQSGSGREDLDRDYLTGKSDWESEQTATQSETASIDPPLPIESLVVVLEKHGFPPEADDVPQCPQQSLRPPGGSTLSSRQKRNSAESQSDHDRSLGSSSVSISSAVSEIGQDIVAGTCSEDHSRSLAPLQPSLSCGAVETGDSVPAGGQRKLYSRSGSLDANTCLNLWSCKDIADNQSCTEELKGRRGILKSQSGPSSPEAKHRSILKFSRLSSPDDSSSVSLLRKQNNESLRTRGILKSSHTGSEERTRHSITISDRVVIADFDRPRSILKPISRPSSPDTTRSILKPCSRSSSPESCNRGILKPPSRPSSPEAVSRSILKPPSRPSSPESASRSILKPSSRASSPEAANRSILKSSPEGSSGRRSSFSDTCENPVRGILKPSSRPHSPESAARGILKSPSRPDSPESVGRSILKPHSRQQSPETGVRTGHRKSCSPQPDRSRTHQDPGSPDRLPSSISSPSLPRVPGASSPSARLLAACPRLPLPSQHAQDDSSLGLIESAALTTHKRKSQSEAESVGLDNLADQLWKYTRSAETSEESRCDLSDPVASESVQPDRPGPLQGETLGDLLPASGELPALSADPVSAMDVMVTTSDSGGSKQPDDSDVPVVIRASGGIKERLAALQRSGGESWQRRVKSCQLPSERLQLPLLSAESQQPESPPPLRRKTRKVDVERPRSHIELVSERLQSANNNWKQRVPQNDAEQFTVAGKMGQILDPLRRMVCSRYCDQQSQPSSSRRDTSTSSDGENSVSTADKSESPRSQQTAPPGGGDVSRQSSISVSSVSSSSSALSARDVFRELDTNSRTGSNEGTTSLHACDDLNGGSSSRQVKNERKSSISSEGKSIPSRCSSFNDEVFASKTSSVTDEVFSSKSSSVTEEVSPKSSSSVTEEVPPKSSSSVTEEVPPKSSSSVTEEVSPPKSSSSVSEESLDTESSVTRGSFPTIYPPSDKEKVLPSISSLDEGGMLPPKSPHTVEEKISSARSSTSVTEEVVPQNEPIASSAPSQSQQTEQLSSQLPSGDAETAPSKSSKFSSGKEDSSKSSKLSDAKKVVVPSELPVGKKMVVPSELLVGKKVVVPSELPLSECEKSPSRSSPCGDEARSPVTRKQKSGISGLIGKLNDDLSKSQLPKPSSPDDAPNSPVVLRRPKNMSAMHNKLSGMFARGPSPAVRMGVPLPGLQLPPSPRVTSSFQPPAHPPPGVAKPHDSDDDSEAKPVSEFVEVPRLANEQFEEFFMASSHSSAQTEFCSTNGDMTAIYEVGDWSSLLEGQTGGRLVSVACRDRVRRHVRTSGNPLRNLQTRDDLVTAYSRRKQTADKTLQSGTNRAQELSKRSTVAVEALAGLAARIDFSAVKLSPAVTGRESQLLGKFQPYLPGIMLLQVKGRRHVQTRLVPPIAASINSGDCYILVTPDQVFGYLGGFSNKMERSRAADICQHVVRTRDLGCSASQPHLIEYECDRRTGGKITAENQMWKLLASGTTTPQAAGAPDEDEVYETAIIKTNRVHEVCVDSESELGFSLKLLEDYCGHLPRYSMLQNDKVFVFDFGSEMYLWTGQWASHKSRVAGKNLVKQLWQSDCDYTEFAISPIYGSTGNLVVKRPDWGICGRVGQNMETVLFKEKFLDWSDSGNVLKVKGCEASESDTVSSTTSSSEQQQIIEPVDALALFEWRHLPCNLVLEMENLGRGREYYDAEERRLLQVESIAVSGWCVSEASAAPLPEGEWPGQMYRDATYVWRWHYRVVHSTRSLSGGASRHATQGRDRCAYFFWQGLESSVNDKGASALMVVELDKEHGPQIRVSQGRESAAFLSLFDGRMMVYRRPAASSSAWRMFVIGGATAAETFLLEVSLSASSLRPRAACLLLNVSSGQQLLWLPAGLSEQLQQLARGAAQRLHETERPPAQLELKGHTVLQEPEEVRQGAESSEFKSVFSDWSQYADALSEPLSAPPALCPKLFSFTLGSGRLQATPVVCPHVSDCEGEGGNLWTPLPYCQRELYGLQQPALVLVDTGSRLFVWQGWRPGQVQHGEEEEDSATEKGEAAAESYRWHQMRRCVFTTAMAYARLCEGRGGVTSGSDTDSPARVECDLVLAGLEPPSFQHMFPDWHVNEEAASCNVQEGFYDGQCISVADVLSALNRDVYPLSTLLSRPLPDGVNPARLENFLSETEFKELLKMDKEEFASLPAWKQTKLKKSVNLF